ncbi:MAG: thiamine phosphate synthase, partial [Henriciella sp.]
MSDPIRQRTRLYLITPPEVADVAAFAASVEDALSGGDVACLQVRIKPDGVIDEAKTEAVARAL